MSHWSNAARTWATPERTLAVPSLELVWIGLYGCCCVMCSLCSRAFWVSARCRKVPFELANVNSALPTDCPIVSMRACAIFCAMDSQWTRSKLDSQRVIHCCEYNIFRWCILCVVRANGCWCVRGHIVPESDTFCLLFYGARFCLCRAQISIRFSRWIYLRRRK